MTSSIAFHKCNATSELQPLELDCIRKKMTVCNASYRTFKLLFVNISIYENVIGECDVKREWQNRLWFASFYANLGVKRMTGVLGMILKTVIHCDYWNVSTVFYYKTQPWMLKCCEMVNIILTCNCALK